MKERFTPEVRQTETHMYCIQCKEMLEHHLFRLSDIRARKYYCRECIHRKDDQYKERMPIARKLFIKLRKSEWVRGDFHINVTLAQVEELIKFWDPKILQHSRLGRIDENRPVDGATNLMVIHQPVREYQNW